MTHGAPLDHLAQPLIGKLSSTVPPAVSCSIRARPCRMCSRRRRRLRGRGTEDRNRRGFPGGAWPELGGDGEMRPPPELALQVVLQIGPIEPAEVAVRVDPDQKIEVALRPASARAIEPNRLSRPMPRARSRAACARSCATTRSRSAGPRSRVVASISTLAMLPQRQRRRRAERAAAAHRGSHQKTSTASVSNAVLRLIHEPDAGGPGSWWRRFRQHAGEQCAQ